jgi:hypothetical protein
MIWEGLSIKQVSKTRVTYNPYVIYTEDTVVAAFEQIASLIIAELNRQGIVENTNPFLDAASKELIYKVEKGNFV